MRVKIFEPCDMEYKEYDKPIKYTEEFLKELASNTVGTSLVDEEHYGNSIGEVKNFTFIDGGLYAEVNSEKPLDDLKYSPSFDTCLVDEGDYWLATKGSLLEIALTSKPRQAILNNTADKGGSRMSDDNNDKTMEYLTKEVDRLQKENAKLEFRLNEASKKVEAHKEVDKELTELREWKETNSKLLEEQKPIIEDYKKYQEAKHEELLEKASKGNAEIKEKLKNFSIDHLQTMVDLETEEQPPRGVGADNAPGLNEGTGEEDNDGKPSKDDMQAYFKSQFGDE